MSRAITRAEAHALFLAREPVAARVVSPLYPRGQKLSPPHAAKVMACVPGLSLTLDGDRVVATQAGVPGHTEVTLGPAGGAAR